MFYGFVKNFSPDKGFGFIGQEGGPDVFFHATAIGEENFSRLYVDQPVMFDLAKRDPDEKIRKGLRATTVKLIARIPGGALPRPTQDLAPRHHPKARQRKATWKRRIDVRPAEERTEPPTSPPDDTGAA